MAFVDLVTEYYSHSYPGSPPIPPHGLHGPLRSSLSHFGLFLSCCAKMKKSSVLFPLSNLHGNRSPLALYCR